MGGKDRFLSAVVFGTTAICFSVAARVLFVQGRRVKKAKRFVEREANEDIDAKTEVKVTGRINSPEAFVAALSNVEVVASQWKITTADTNLALWSSHIACHIYVTPARQGQGVPSRLLLTSSEDPISIKNISVLPLASLEGPSLWRRLNPFIPQVEEILLPVGTEVTAVGQLHRTSEGDLAIGQNGIIVTRTSDHSFTRSKFFWSAVSGVCSLTSLTLGVMAIIGDWSWAPDSYGSTSLYSYQPSFRRGVYPIVSSSTLAASSS